MLLKPPIEQIVTEAPVNESESTARKPAPNLPKLKKTAQIVPTRGTAAGMGTPSSSRKQGKEKGKESDKPEESEDDNADKETEDEHPEQVLETQQRRKRAPASHFDASPIMRVRTSQRRERRLLQVLVQSSSCRNVLVHSHPVVPLPPQVGEVLCQEALVPVWVRLQERRRSNS